MKITRVTIVPVMGQLRVKGIASIVLDNELAINEIKIIQAEKGMCVEFPGGKKEKFGYQNVAPLNKKIRGYLQTAIIDAYQLKLEAE